MNVSVYLFSLVTLEYIHTGVVQFLYSSTLLWMWCCASERIRRRREWRHCYITSIFCAVKPLFFKYPNINSVNQMCSGFPTMLIIEPFYGGSHKVLIDTLTKGLPENSYTLITLPAKKWHWRARCGALALSNMIPQISSEQVLFCSSVLSLAELLGLRPDLIKLKKVIYFHENQLVYPVQQIKERDVQYAYNQITASLAADVVLFNSQFNLNSFLDNIQKIIKLMPDHRPKTIRSQIAAKCKILYFPVDFSTSVISQKHNHMLVIVWPHRWEYDKGPGDLHKLFIKLKDHNLKFKVSIIGETFTDTPDVFSEMKLLLEDSLLHFGYVPNREDYLKVLYESHIVLSTAKHEFFGVSMLEATHCGCLPLAPDNLVYPEIFPGTCLYSDLDNLFNKVSQYCENPQLAVEHRKSLEVDFNKYSSKNLLPEYLKLLQGNDTSYAYV